MAEQIVWCDSCGKPAVRLHRRYREKGYCQKCYLFFFRVRACSTCGEMARLSVEFPESVCIECEKKKPCVRCGRTGYQLGKLTIYGPVCNSCSYWFRKARPCSRCGEKSRLLNRVYRSGYDEQICPACARIDHSCCNACRRHRKLSRLPDGRELCLRCLTYGEIKCDSCGKSMPAGYGKTCEECYWLAVFIRRRNINSALFSSKAVASCYDTFCVWLGKNYNSRMAARLVDRYSAIFFRLEQLQNGVPDWLALFCTLSPGELRKYPLLERWIGDDDPLLNLATVKALSAERHYTEAILARCIGSQIEGIAQQYACHLYGKAAKGNLCMRSVRLALNAAVALLELSLAAGHYKPAQRDVVRYLHKAPGQKACLWGFITFLNRTYHADLSVPADYDGTQAKRQQKRLEARLRDLMDDAGSFDETKWLRVALAFFHGVSLKRADWLLKNGELKRSEDGFILAIGGDEYWLPAPKLYPTHRER